MDKIKYNGDEVLFTSDLHFGHANIINYCDRPFSSKEEMNDALVKNWNSVVDDSHHVFILGDLSFMPLHETIILISQLKGIKHLILGNHDFKNEDHYKKSLHFESVDYYKEIYVNGSLVCLFHFPIDMWNGLHRGSYHLHGHIHSKDGMRQGKRMDVGVDANQYAPVDWHTIKSI
jgi:calcineurin-like phosphoesterase family protein